MDQLISAADHFYEATHHLGKARALRPVERKLTKAIQKAFRAQGKAFVRGLVHIQDQFPTEASERGFTLTPSGIYRPLIEVLNIDSTDVYFEDSDDDSLDLFKAPIQDAAETLLAAGAKQILAELDVNLSFSLANPRAVTYIEQHGGALIAKINDETRSQIKTLLRQAAEEGWSYQKTAQAIIGKYDDMAVGVPGNYSSRAERIAVTEAGEAYEEGNWIPIQDLAAGGIQTEKQWDTAPELSKSGPCEDICQPNADQGWIPSDESFQSGDDHPLGHVGCYCDCLYQLKGA